MHARSLMLGLLLCGAAVPATAQIPRVKVAATADKHVNFETLGTYSWSSGWSAFDASVDRQIVSTVDRSLARLGLVKMESDGDVSVTYGAMVRTDVDLKSKKQGPNKVRREYPVGIVVVLLLEPGTDHELYRARADVPLASEPEAVVRQIELVVSRMFDDYPTRKTARK